MKKIVFIIAAILLAVLAACAANIEIPEEPEETYTAADYGKYASGRPYGKVPGGYFSGYANSTGKYELTKFYHPKTGEFQGSAKINVGYAFDGERAYVGAWYDYYPDTVKGCEIKAVVTRVEGRFDKLKVVATCIAPNKEGSHQIVYYLTATGTGNLIRTSE